MTNKPRNRLDGSGKGKGQKDGRRKNQTDKCRGNRNG